MPVGTQGRADALLVLEDGTAMRGRSLGAPGETFGEAVFNTGMAGYQEVLTDPSYAGQIVTMTSPHQGNTGMNADDAQAARPHVAGFVVREASRRPSNWRATSAMPEDLAAAGIVGIEGVDTRCLTRRIRDRGAMRAAISTIDLDPASLVARTRTTSVMTGADLAASVSTPEPYEAAAVVGPPSIAHGHVFRVAAVDFGMKRTILHLLADQGLDVTVLPATTPGEEIARGGFDGVFLSNGPGDPAATSYGIRTARALVGTLPIFGICLGHQLLALALGGRTYKMPFGHRGANQPVLDVETGLVEITSHNHGFAVDRAGWGTAVDGMVAAEAGRIAFTHRNLNDDTLEGLRCLDLPAFSVQYHPEAAPGPHDARHHFGRFRSMLEAA